ncbi:MAG: peptidase S41 [Magnetovibrio sp.]|nr:peptidase S41 [Magnetovibrio sp.]|tara:strand:- start:383 stop:1909 length:1527 start_codon:yes stop_codon:yes gene_type:complete
MIKWHKSPRTFFIIAGIFLAVALVPTISGCSLGKESQTTLNRVIEAVGDRFRPLPPEAKLEFKRFVEVYKKYATKPVKDSLDYFNFAFKRVRTKYVHKVSDKILIDSSIEGVTDLKREPHSIKPDQVVEVALDKMVTSLDPHSSYLNKEEFKESFIQTKGEFGGLGIEVTMQDGVVKIVAPIEDTPAERAGVFSGDLITHVDGKSIKNLGLSQSVRRMRGTPGSAVRLTIKRDGVDAFDVTIIRAIIKVRAIRWKTIGPVGYIRVSRFSERVESGIMEALAAIRAKLDDKITGFILDLRNNPGGLLDQSVILADTFLDNGEIVSIRGRDEINDRIFLADDEDLAEGLPIVVLINGGSASASEIVASALKYHNRAVVMGTSSFGKGSVQTIIPMPGEGALRLTTALYYGPDGNSIQARGVSPDIQIVSDIIKEKQNRETDLPGFLPGQTRLNFERVATITNRACPGIKGSRQISRKVKNEDRTLGCAVAYFGFKSRQSFLAAYSRSSKM